MKFDLLNLVKFIQNSSIESHFILNNLFKYAFEKQSHFRHSIQDCQNAK